MAGLHFDITGDNTNLMEKLKEVERGVRATSSSIEKEGGSIEQLFSRMSRAAAAFGAGFTAKELIQNIVRVRGEFQQLEVAFTTMLGSQEKANALMSQLTETAAKTPFDLQGVANGARQLLAYGTAAEDVNGTLIRLGNIAAGLSIPLNDLVYLYGTTMTQGRLYTQDLNQFTGRGIPMIRELAKEFGVAETEIKSMVEAGKVGFPEVQRVIQNLTNEGGMFYNLMQEQSRTITGQISNIEDSFSMMLNNIGQANEGIINDALSGVSYLIENYETVGRVLLEIVGTYGAYRAALVTITALQRAYSAILAQSALNQSLAAASGITLSNAQALAATRTKLLQVAQAALNRTLLANPYVAAAAAVAALGLGIYKLATYQTEAEKAQQRLNDAVKESEKASLSEQKELAKLKGELSALREGTDEYNAVKEKIVKGYGKYYDGLEEEINKVGLTEEAYNKLTEAITRSFGARQYEKYKSEQESILDEKLADNLGKIQDRLYDELGDEKGAEIYTKIRQAILERKEISNDIQAILDDVQDKGTMLADARLDGYIRNVQEAISITEEMDKQARERFGITGVKSSSDAGNESSTTDTKKTYREAYKEAEANWKAKIKAVEDAKNKSRDEYIKAVQEAESAEKDFKALGGLTGTALSKQQKEADKEKESRQKLSDQILDLQEKNQQAEIELMQDGTEKKLAQINADYSAQKSAIARQQRELAEANKDAGITSTNAGGLTTEQQTEIDRALELLTKQRTQQILGVYKEEFSAMRDNLEEYGNYQQQKLALAQEYAEKIAAAQTEGERRSLEQERDNRMSSIETQRLKSEIDWSVAFGEFGGMFADVIRPVLEQARQYMQTDEFKNADHDSQRTLIDAVQQMEESLGGASKVNFKKLASDIDAYRKSLVQLRNAQGQYDDAYKELSEAQQEYLEALENGTDAEKEAAKQAVDEAQSKVDAASVAVNGLTESSEKAKTAITDTATTLKTSMDGVVGGLQKLTSGSLRGAYDGLIELGKSAKNISGLGKVGDAMGTIAKGLENVPIVGWIASILDVLKDGLTDFIQTIHDSATSAVTNIFDDVFSGDLLKQGFNNTLDSIEKTIGMFGIDFSFSGSNAKEVQATIDRLTDRNEALQSSIDALNDTMKEARGTETVQAAKQAEEYQKEVNRNYLEMAMAQAGYHGSHHSWNYYWGGFSKEQIDKLSEQIGREWSGSLWDLSPEEMKMLKGNVDMWTQIQNTGEGGYGGRLTEKLDDYIDQAGKLEEITDTLYESLTQISFDSMYDSFVDNLMNMEYSAQDAADDIAEYFMRAMLSNKIGEMYADKLEEWYKKFAGAMEDDGTLDDDEIAALRDEYLGYVEEALKLRDELAAATGYEGTSAQEQQSATAGYSTTASQESIDQMFGRFTALYEVGLQIYNTLQLMQTMTVSVDEQSSILSEIRNIVISSNGYLEDIAGFQKKIWEKVDSRLDSINNVLNSKL